MIKKTYEEVRQDIRIGKISIRVGHAMIRKYKLKPLKVNNLIEPIKYEV